jgi:DNA-binding NtrC family response regulator
VRRLCILGLIEHGDKADCAERRTKESEEGPPPLKEYLERMEKDFIEGVLRQNKGQVASACARLGISRKSLYDKVHRLAIDLNSFRKAD